MSPDLLRKVDTGSISSVENWKPDDVENIYERLELTNWPLWLVDRESVLAERVKVFPQGQFLIRDQENLPIACLSTNRVNWLNAPDTEGLPPSWDYCAGVEPGKSFGDAYDPNGNALVLLVVNIHPDYQGQQMPSHFLKAAKEFAKSQNIDYIISPFRPSNYGEYKLKYEDPGFARYCAMKREDGVPIDGWIRNLTRNGMGILTPCDIAMKRVVSLDDFEKFKNDGLANGQTWIEVKPNIWECGETGSWIVDENRATYLESNLWGMIDIE